MTFGPFRLFPARQLLLEGDAPVRLGSRALEILLALVERASELVSKDELVARVWPNTFVEEGNLRVHIAALRRALGDGHAGNRYIATIPGRGYRFVAPVALADEPQSGEPSPPVRERQERTGGLPASLSRLLGRGATIDALVHDLQRHRLITIVGPGGIGKTTVALAAAQRGTAAYPDGVYFVDLAPLSGPALVASTLASAVGVASNTGNLLPSLTTHLGARRVLLLLDNCEHVVEAAAALAEELLKACPNLGILATSREALRAESERVRRLGPLETPPADTSLTASEALQYPAVQLFVERAAAALDDFTLTDENAGVVAAICRRLDGMALAIELAASRVDAFGAHGLAIALNDRFRLLTGRRTALPRHRTLGAMLDWSYAFLTEAEQTVLRRLSVFAGRFSLDSAIAVAAGEAIAARDVADRVADLVAKSLVTADVAGPTVTYRLLDTTRAYANEKLVESGEMQAIARRHASHFAATLAGAEKHWETNRTAELLTLYSPSIDDLRAALDWAFGPGGDESIGIGLTVAAVPLWMHLSLVDECNRRVELALARRTPAASDRRRDMQLYTALGTSLMFTKGAIVETLAALNTALDIAENLGDSEYAMRALWGMWVGRLNNGFLPEALTLAQRFRAVAEGSRDALDAAIGERMIGFSMHFLGDQVGARGHIERMLARDPGDARRAHAYRFQFEQWSTARAALAEVLWLLGEADQAMAAAHQSIADAELANHAVTKCNTLAKCSAVALFAGDYAAAGRMNDALIAEAASHSLSFWSAEGSCLEAVLLIRRGELAQGLGILQKVLYGFRWSTLTVRYIAFLGELADALSRSGEVGAANSAIGEALGRSEQNEERWCVSELLRIKAGILLREGGPDAEGAAEALFAESLDWARRQHAIAWELRTATSLAELRRVQGRPAEAREILAPVYGRFREGLGTADLVAARALLDALP